MGKTTTNAPTKTKPRDKKDTAEKNAAEKSATEKSVTEKSATEKSATSTEKSEKAEKVIRPYNRFMQTELPKVKAENPEMDHKTAFKKVAELWKTSPENPKNQTQNQDQ